MKALALSHGQTDDRAARNHAAASLVSARLCVGAAVGPRTSGRNAEPGSTSATTGVYFMQPGAAAGQSNTWTY